MSSKRVFCTSCVAFVVALLVFIPVVFVWNLFLHGQGSFNWFASLMIAVSVACVSPIVMLARKGRESWRQ